MSQCSGTYRSPLDIPSCPMVQLDGTDSVVGCIGVYYGKVHIVPEVLMGPMDIHFGQRDSDGKLGHSLLQQIPHYVHPLHLEMIVGQKLVQRAKV